MFKKLLSIAAVAALAFGASAATYELPLTAEAMNCKWSSTYDEETKTITYEGDWAGCGWYLGKFDATEYTQVVVKFEKATQAGQIVVTYNELVYDENGEIKKTDWGEDMHEESTKSWAVGDEEIVVGLNPKFKDSIQQIVLKDAVKASEPTITLISAIIEDVPFNFNAFEGSQALNWWPGIQIANDYLPYLTEGAKIEITFAEGEGVFKVQTQNADWTQTWLPCLAELPTANVVEATEEKPSDCYVGVTAPEVVTITIDAKTAELIATANYLIVAGNESLTVSKVEIIPAPEEEEQDILAAAEADQDKLLAYAAEVEPILYPEDGEEYSEEIVAAAEKVYDLVFDALAEVDAAYEEAEETGVYVSPLTDQVIADIEAALKAFTSGINGITVATAARYYNLQGVEVANPAAGQIYIRVANGKAVKVIK